jgi:hypothetical protein
MRLITPIGAVAGEMMNIKHVHGYFHHADSALEAGADDFDTKPINLVGLLEKMTALLSA